MKKTPYSFLPLLFAMLFAGTTEPAHAQISVQIGPAPVCPYGYFDYSPYDCAPYGYYGPEWFSNGVFVGAGPWYHGRERFWGHVDRHYDRRYGYRGAYPHRGDRFEERYRDERWQHFRGNDYRDGHGHSRYQEHHDRGRDRDHDHDRDHDRH